MIRGAAGVALFGWALVVSGCSSGSDATTSTSPPQTTAQATSTTEAGVTTTVAVRADDEWKHKFPAEYIGEVYVVVTADELPTAIRLRWGPYERLVTQTEPRSVYWFRKLSADQPGKEVFVRVKADAPVVVEYNTGSPPAGAIDINANWYRF